MTSLTLNFPMIKPVKKNHTTTTKDTTHSSYLTISLITAILYLLFIVIINNAAYNDTELKV